MQGREQEYMEGLDGNALRNDVVLKTYVKIRGKCRNVS
jgi:hypothetical protein